MTTVKLEFTLPDKYAGSDMEMFAAMVAASIGDVIKCIVKNKVKLITERETMLDNLGFYAINDSDELPAILDKLLAAKDTDADLYEICPELELWQNVENWSYNDLMAAIS
jgi:muconolactone delta-isomerase